MTTVNTWIDDNMKNIYGKRIRIIDSQTRKGVGDMMMMYFDREVKGIKITSQFIFIFI